ncbi:hypothetical protein RRG08_040121 [Elysia crispata]|uniref:Neurotransmitter-gated ion-channel transmembrane domain-containing protein n=1 Tax=Elysia crispata TaxID=231223 RepID=A0AAE0XVY6_9GAST|nr:hypothetical protein RRG08_040121 [Elysia crispata]
MIVMRHAEAAHGNNAPQETLELKEVHLTPAPMGVANSQSFSLDLEDGQADVAGYRMAPIQPRPIPPHSHSASFSRSHAHGTSLRRRSSSHVPPRRRRLLSHFRQKAKSIKVKIPRVQDVNTIDKYARLFFPLLFVLFNASYWAVYLLTFVFGDSATFKGDEKIRRARNDLITVLT